MVDSVEIGDFEVEPKLFDVNYWPPIKQGLKVHDARVQPPEIFVWTDGRFEERVLHRVRHEERIRKTFDVAWTPLERLKRELEIVKLVNQHLLVVFALPDDPRVHRLMDIRFNDADYRTLADEFRHTQRGLGHLSRRFGGNGYVSRAVTARQSLFFSGILFAA